MGKKVWQGSAAETSVQGDTMIGPFKISERQLGAQVVIEFTGAGSFVDILNTLHNHGQITIRVDQVSQVTERSKFRVRARNTSYEK